MIKDLIALAREYPDITISVKLADLLEANAQLIANTKKELEQSLTEASTETYQTREEAMRLLSVGETTLWRWQKSGYLVPISVGGKKRYRTSDVKRILEGKQ